ncbi:hypothetical protein AWV63_02495 [Micromonospora rifamycinica]|nr:hypothetical protein AWV63_02495 [Micromonospora rifamycinica]
MGVQRVAHGGRRAFPDPINEAVDRDDLPGMRHEHGQHQPLFNRPEDERHPVYQHFYCAEQAKIPIGHSATTLPPTPPYELGSVSSSWPDHGVK